MSVKPKKHFGQHFLTDANIARKTAALAEGFSTSNILEIGPGTGMLTQFLLENSSLNLQLIEIDKESVAYLAEHFPETPLLAADFLRTNLNDLFQGNEFAIIGNFPYNISSQILFKVLDHTERIPNVAGMFQLELAQRVASEPHSKAYGVISVLFQAFYEVKIEFKISPKVFNPPPKVTSAVISAKRKESGMPECDHRLFKRVVKAAFGQRRKTLANSLGVLNIAKEILNQNQFAKLRAENLSVDDFAELTRILEPELKA